MVRESLCGISDTYLEVDVVETLDDVDALLDVDRLEEVDTLNFRANNYDYRKNLEAKLTTADDESLFISNFRYEP